MKKAIALITSLCVLGLSFPVNGYYHKSNSLTACAAQGTTKYKGGFYFELTDTEAHITRCDRSFFDKDNITIPDNYEGLPVTKVSFEGLFNASDHYYFEDIRYISVPYTVTELEVKYLGRFSNLEKFVVNSKNEVYSAVDGVIFSKDKKAIIAYPAGRSGSFYDVSETVERIEDFAFSGSKYLKSVIIPETVTEIGTSAFSGCSSLLEMRIPDAVKEISSGMFAGCNELESFYLPNAITSIGSGAFISCHSLESIDIPPTVSEIGSAAFMYDRNLREVYLPPELKIIDSAVFNECTNLQKIEIPKKVTEIRDAAFYNCENLTYVTFHDSLKSIGSASFLNCGNLKLVEFPSSVNEIGSSAFYDCKALESVKFNDGITAIRSAAFYGCSSLKQVVLPETLETIGASAFVFCDNLKLADIKNPNCIIGEGAKDTENLKSTFCNRLENDDLVYEGVIRGFKSSTAETYAKKCGYTFKADYGVADGAATEDNDPIIIIPGIMGSRLFINENCTDCIWPPDEFQLLDPFLNPFDLTSPTFTDYISIYNQLYVKEPVNLKNAAYSQREFGAQDNMKDLVNAICDSFRDRDIYVFSYDWRRSNAESAESLNDFIQSLGVEKVDIVAHSMGGLVTSKYIKQHGTMKVDKIITCGTPYEGSPEAINAVVNFEVLRGDNAFKDLALGVCGLTRDIKNQFPGIAQLTPTRNYYAENPVYRDDMILPISFDEYQDKLNSIFYGSVYSDAYSFQQSLHNENTDYNVLLGYDKSYFLVGTGKYTLKTLEFDSWLDDIDNDTFAEKFSNVFYTNAGDGTVPLYSGTISEQIATLEPGRYRIVSSTHLGLISEENENPNFDNLTWIANILRNKDDDQPEPAYSHSPYSTYGIHCPVDVEIGSGDDRLCSAADDISLRSSFGRLDIFGKDNDLKSVCMDEDTNLDITLTGTDTGTMDFTVCHFSAENELLDKRIFEDVPLTDKTVIKTKADNNEVTVLSVDKDGDGVVDETWTAKKNETVTAPDETINVVTTVSSPVTTASAPTETTVSSTTAAESSEPETHAASLGDLNKDGVVDSSDASEILMLYAQVSTGGGEVSADLKAAADINGDGLVDSSDASLILEYYAYVSTGGTDTADEFFSKKA